METTSTAESTTTTTLLSTLIPPTELTITTEDTTQVTTTKEATTAKTTILSSIVFPTTTIAETTSTEESKATTLLSTIKPPTELILTTEYTTQALTTAESTISTSTLFPTTIIQETTSIEGGTTAATLVSTITPTERLITEQKNEVISSTELTTSARTTETLKLINGSALVQSKMVINSSTPVPSESLVLSAIQILLDDRLTNLTDYVNLLNFTFEAISDTSYAVTFTFNISNISIPENPELRNDTYAQVKGIINKALNTLLNDPGAELFQPQSFLFTSSKNQVYGNMDYYFQDGDTKTPAAFLKELAPVYVS
ncbi:uncharacterized protein LOC128528830 [Clarias gariepinus]|uniref:uncharacterized protein LOC128528830 n=1 Tax=Clarias gariepinus TaxID=13013 RepID=UPI00234D1F5C|nr:uncharacterized protein LOC128528830 [Clarias gariepinus]